MSADTGYVSNRNLETFEEGAGEGIPSPQLFFRTSYSGNSPAAKLAIVKRIIVRIFIASAP